MNSHRHQIRWALPAMLLLVVGAAGAAYAADGEVTFGTQWWDQTAREAKYEEFRDIPNGPFIGSFVLLDKIDGGRFAIVGEDALQHDQSTTVLYRRSRWTIGGRYQEIPHNFSFVARSPFQKIAAGYYALPDTIQRRVQEDPAAQASNTLRDLVTNSGHIPLGFRTDLTRLGMKGRLGGGLQLDLRGMRRQRSGTKPYGFSFGFNNVVEIVEPISQQMAMGEARLSYARNKLVVEAAGGFDAFDNDIDALIVDNPRRYTDSPTAGSSRGRIDLYPDNRTIRGDLKLGLQLPHRSVLSAFAGIREVRQDDRWLPFTINAAIVGPDSFPLADNNTDGKATITTEDVRLVTSPSRRVSGTLRFRHWDYDNKTPLHDFPGQVAYDQTWQPADVETHPVGFTNTTFGADLDFMPHPRVTVTGTAETTKRERTFREVAEDNEVAFEGKLRVRPRTGLELEGRYRHADRELDHFEEADYQNASGVFLEQPTLRRFDVGDRQQEQARGVLGWWGMNDRAQVSFAYEYLRNKYEDQDLPGIGAPLSPDTSETQLGLLDETRRNISANAAYQLSSRWDVSGGYGWVQVYTNQRSRESSTSAVRLDDSTTWQARLKDWFVYANAAITWHPVIEKLSVVGTYEFERSPSVYRLTNFRGTAQDLPTSKYRRQGVGIEGWYTFDPATSLGLRWGWEEFSVTDFATENVPLLFPFTGTSNAIFLGDSYQDYHAHAVAVMMRKTF